MYKIISQYHISLPLPLISVQIKHSHSHIWDSCHRLVQWLGEREWGWFKFCWSSETNRWGTLKVLADIELVLERRYAVVLFPPCTRRYSRRAQAGIVGSGVRDPFSPSHFYRRRRLPACLPVLPILFEPAAFSSFQSREVVGCIGVSRELLFSITKCFI